MWLRNTFQRPAKLGTLTAMAAGGPFRALQCFYFKLWEAGCLSGCQSSFSSSIPVLGQFLAVSCWTVPLLPATLVLLQPQARSQTSACQELLCLPVCLTSHTGFSDGKAVCGGESYIWHLPSSLVLCGRAGCRACLPSFLPSSLPPSFLPSLLPFPSVQLLWPL